MAAALLVWRREHPAATGQAIRSIAVLPLDNYSADSTQDYFAEGMTDELTSDLATISQLRVISRGSVMQFKGQNRPATPEIARILDVDAIVEGSVTRSGDRVRITAQLIDARADRHLWSQTFERQSTDVLALQAELASAIAGAINVQLTPGEQSRLSALPRVNPEAHDAYLKGRYFFNRPSDENLQKAIAQFEEAIRLSPTFAPAYSGLSDAYTWAAYYEGPDQRHRREAPRKGIGRTGRRAGQPAGGGAHLPGRVQGLVRFRLGGGRAGASATPSPSTQAMPSRTTSSARCWASSGVLTRRLPKASWPSRWTRSRRPSCATWPMTMVIAGNATPALELAQKAAELDPSSLLPGRPVDAGAAGRELRGGDREIRRGCWPSVGPQPWRRDTSGTPTPCQATAPGQWRPSRNSSEISPGGPLIQPGTGVSRPR